MSNAGKRSDGMLLAALLFAAIFVPGHMFNWLIEWIFVGLLTVFCSVYLALAPWRGSAFGIEMRVWATGFCLMCAASAASLLIVLLRARGINERDIVEMFRFPIYGVLVCFVAARMNECDFDPADRVLRLSVLYVLVCAAAYQLKFPILYPAISAVYADAKVLFGIGVIRIPFPFENPNFLAYYLVLLIYYFSFVRRSWLFIGLSLVLLFLSGSRSGWIASAAVLAFAFLNELTEERVYRRILSGALLGAIVIASIVYWEQLKTFGRLAELVTALQGDGIGGVETARVRFETVDELFAWIERSPVVGWGPGRALGLDVADNQYVSSIVAWGLFGFTLMMVASGLVFARFWAVARQRSDRLGVVGVALGLGLMFGTGDFFENYRLFFITLLVLHIAFKTLERSASSSATSRHRSLVPRLTNGDPSHTQ